MGGKSSIKTDAKRVAASSLETSLKENLTDETIESEELSSPSAPPLPNVVTDTIATAINNHDEGTSNLSEEPTALSHVNTIKNLWNSFNNNQNTASPSPAPQCIIVDASHAIQPCKLECSICLDPFRKNDEIAWAKDGGDKPRESATVRDPNSENG